MAYPPRNRPSTAARPKPPQKPSPPRHTANNPPPGWKDPLAQRQPLVSVRWLLRTLFLVIAAAFVTAYFTLCLLFYQGQWQIVFHPSKIITTTPATLGLTYDEVHFDYTQSGAPQLAGWWLPATPNPNSATPNQSSANPPQPPRTILYLHDATGNLSTCAAQLNTLHTLGLNLFTFDYRGFGQSAPTHPSESRVYEDADAAWTYLTDTRKLDPKSIVLYGQGLGATIAAETALRHPEARLLILDNPNPPALTLIQSDSRTHIIPIRLLFRDRFDLAPKLQALDLPLPQATQTQIDRSRSVQATLTTIRKSSPTGRDLLLLLGPTASERLPALRSFLKIP